MDTSVVKCSECGSRNLILDESKGERHCSDCGLILEDTMIDPGPEWVNHSSESKDRSRVGMPVNALRHDKGLSTDLDWRNSDYSGTPISSKARAQYYRMRKWQQRSRQTNSRERALQQGYQVIESVASKLGLSKPCAERAGNIYKKAQEEGVVRGRSIAVCACACLYISNQLFQTGRTVEDIAQASKISNKEIGRVYRGIKRDLRIRTPAPTPLVYIDRFCSELGLPASVKSRTKEIISEADSKDIIDGKSPCGIAAACIYIAASLEGFHRTQRDISIASNTTEVTIRNRYKEICRVLGYEVSAAPYTHPESKPHEKTDASLNTVHSE